MWFSSCNLKVCEENSKAECSPVGMAVLWIPVFQCNTIVILSESKLNCLCYQKELWICMV